AGQLMKKLPLRSQPQNWLIIWRIVGYPETGDPHGQRRTQLVARWKMDLLLLRSRWWAFSNMENTTRRRISCPGNKKWRSVWIRVCGRTLSLFTRSLVCQEYGRCHCRAGKKPAFWTNPSGNSLCYLAGHSLLGGTGHLVRMEFTSSISG